MNTEKLSARLQLVVNFIPKGYNLADIGSDHAYLPCYAVKKGIVPFAIAGEVVEGPYQSALRQVKDEELTNRVSVRKGNGLEVIQPGEVDCITIAGMGGTLISNILEAGKEKLVNVKRLILQPNISAISIRQWLIQNDWELVEEEIIEEDGKIYEVLVAERGNSQKPYQMELHKGLLLGPFLLKRRNEVFIKKWLDEKRNWEKIMTQLLSASQTVENMGKMTELKAKIKMVEEVLEK
ncbi:tRNA (adenine(22)-N(1))-methyltransferase [Bacillus sp. CGMCC 1.16607]|uniref:tRNA (adenine(22)-N(1))-methyltransferase n=1 Tax=Bacillus sp. CGMCC 1.16607 TaxID=3351842 RepID=UPI00363B2066